MAKFSINLHPLPKKDGTCALMFSFTHKHFRKQIYLGVDLEPGQWNSKDGKVEKHPHSRAIAASLDIPKEAIAAALGHGGNIVTDIYIDFDRRKVNEASRRVLDWVLYGKHYYFGTATDVCQRLYHPCRRCIHQI